MKRFNEFELRDQLPIPPMSLNDIITDEEFELTEIESSVYDIPYQVWELELNTNQDTIEIKIEPSDKIDGPTEYMVKVDLERNSKGRAMTGRSLYSLNEIQVVRFILEIFDKYGMIGNQYNQYWEI